MRDTVKVVVISDTHMHHPKLPSGDLLIHCGDATMRGTADALKKTASWMKAQKFKHRVFVPGNHDVLFDRDLPLALTVMEGVDVLIDRALEVDGIKMYGTPPVPQFMTPDRSLKAVWERIPHGLDILVTHGPPHSILDTNRSGVHCGSATLLEAVRIAAPRFHVFGHIHEGYGREIHGATEYINASIMNESYKPLNRPVVFTV